MEIKAVIARLNELYHQSQHEKLTDVQLEERDRLRRIYLNAIRQQVEVTLTANKMEPEGHVHGPDCHCESKYH